MQPGMTTFTALLVAGKRPGVDPLAAHFGQAYKVLVPIDGEAMLSRVAKTLVTHPRISRVLVLAQERQPLIEHPDTLWLADHPKIQFETGGDSVSAAVSGALSRNPSAYPVLLTTADHPLLSHAMLDAVARGLAGHDLAVGVVESHCLLAAYPGNQRTWLRFRGGAYTGANLFGFGSARVDKALQLWRRVEQDRKKGWTLIAAFGPLILVGVALRLLSLSAALRAAGCKLGLDAVPVVIPIAEAGIDVDKVSDHSQVEAILQARRHG
jgi:GTP:adenosylcobinamide-phosphate guanylyltransferase